MLENKVTVIIPTKNEEQTIEEVINNVKKYINNIVVIDGHSTDKTREIVQSLNVPVILDDGKGKGSAIRKAIDMINTEILVFIDADMSHDAADIPRLIQPILDGKADHVSGSRMLGGSDELYGDISKFFKELASHTITLFINYYFNVRLTDTQNGFRAIRTAVAKKLNLKENSFTIEQEMIIRTLKGRFRIVEVPTHEFVRKGGKEKLKLWKTWFKYIWSLLKNLYFKK
ncbi:MAG: glycosyltransferase family 2 protein [Candidatus Omnitrophota bacterium]|nr:glycosyltransferase family 2 protein [Candidatus Omnitrophota bacterium]